MQKNRRTEPLLKRLLSLVNVSRFAVSVRFVQYVEVLSTLCLMTEDELVSFAFDAFASRVYGVTPTHMYPEQFSTLLQAAAGYGGLDNELCLAIAAVDTYRLKHGLVNKPLSFEIFYEVSARRAPCFRALRRPHAPCSSRRSIPPWSSSCLRRKTTRKRPRSASTCGPR